MTNLRIALQERVIIADGAMGTMLQAADLNLDDFEGHEGCNEIINITRPEVVADIHREYFAAGSDAVETNTFGCNWANLAEYGIEDRIYELAHAGARIARMSADEFSAEAAVGLLERKLSASEASVVGFKQSMQQAVDENARLHSLLEELEAYDRPQPSGSSEDNEAARMKALHERSQAELATLQLEYNAVVEEKRSQLQLSEVQIKQLVSLLGQKGITRTPPGETESASANPPASPFRSRVGALFSSWTGLPSP